MSITTYEVFPDGSLLLSTRVVLPASDALALTRQLAAAHGYQLVRGVALTPLPHLDATPLRPRIVCLCGSTRFYQAYLDANFAETLAGSIVLSVGAYPHGAVAAHGQDVAITPAQKLALDELHKRKIDLADEILVLDVGGYIGTSTRSEILYAAAHGKPIRYLSQETTFNPPDAAPGDHSQTTLPGSATLTAEYVAASLGPACPLCQHPAHTGPCPVRSPVLQTEACGCPGASAVARRHEGMGCSESASMPIPISQKEQSDE